MSTILWILLGAIIEYKFQVTAKYGVPFWKNELAPFIDRIRVAIENRYRANKRIDE